MEEIEPPLSFHDSFTKLWSDLLLKRHTTIKGYFDADKVTEEHVENAIHIVDFFFYRRQRRFQQGRDTITRIGKKNANDTKGFAG